MFDVCLADNVWQPKCGFTKKFRYSQHYKSVYVSKNKHIFKSTNHFNAVNIKILVFIDPINETLSYLM